MKVFNLYNDELDNSNEREGWSFRAAKVGEHIGGELIGAGLCRQNLATRSGRITHITPMRSGSSSFAASPRSARPKGSASLTRGMSSASPGARRERIRSERKRLSDSCAMLSTLVVPDIVEFLDTGKVGARSVAGEPIMFGRPGPELDYWEGEE